MCLLFFFFSRHLFVSWQGESKMLPRVRFKSGWSICNFANVCHRGSFSSLVVLLIYSHFDIIASQSKMYLPSWMRACSQPLGEGCAGWKRLLLFSSRAERLYKYVPSSSLDPVIAITRCREVPWGAVSYMCTFSPADLSNLLLQLPDVWNTAEPLVGQRGRRLVNTRNRAGEKRLT